jgi:hypothetical protein
MTLLDEIRLIPNDEIGRTLQRIADWRRGIKN